MYFCLVNDHDKLWKYQSIFLFVFFLHFSILRKVKSDINVTIQTFSDNLTQVDYVGMLIYQLSVRIKEQESLQEYQTQNKNKKVLINIRENLEPFEN